MLPQQSIALSMPQEECQESHCINVAEQGADVFCINGIIVTHYLVSGQNAGFLPVLARVP